MLITDIVRGKKSQSEVYVDGQFYCSVSNDILALNGLTVGQEVSEETLENLLFESEIELAKEKSFCLLEKRNYSKFELIGKLKKDFSEEIAEQVADKMQDLGLINDESFARVLAQDLLESKHYSKHRAKLELAKKGLDKELAAAVLDDFEVDEEKAIKDLVEKKYRRAFEDEKIKRRAAAFLQRQGYGFGAIKRVLWQNDF